MVPPPSQAGKFKPRKPPKKIKAGVTTESKASAVAGSNVASTSSASSETRGPSRGPSRGRGGRRGSGGRGTGNRGKAQASGSGRGRGRGGRRPPVSLPRGAVYFTGNQPEQATTKQAASRKAQASQSAGARSASTADTVVSAGVSMKSKGGAQRGQVEIIVGELDVAIGSKAPASAIASKVQQEAGSPTRAATNSDAERDAPKMSSTLLSIIDTYDSDSSLEESHEQSRRAVSSLNVPPPTQLPFPIQGGPKQGQAMYACQMAGNGIEAKDQQLQKKPSRSSGSIFTAQPRQDEWTLWQFPTRLPSLAFNDSNLASETTATPTPDIIASNSNSAEQPIIVDPVTSTPAAAPTASSLSAFASELKAYDDSLNTAKAGKLGRIVVFKSGKAVLVMGGRDGFPEIRMDVSEGLSCGFVQQAVSIDTEEGTYVPLGDVKKTVVVSPDVERAFPSQS